MFKNVASQKIALYAFDATAGTPKTGDSANMTGYVSKDYGSVTILGTSTPTEMDATNAKGLYLFTLTQAETNADCLIFSAKSSTSNIFLVPVTVYTDPPNYTSFSLDGSGRVDVIKINSVSQSTPGSAGGLFIAGSNAATTISGLTLSGANAVTTTPANAGLTITGGAASTSSGGTAAPAIVATGGAGAASTNGSAAGATFTAGGTTTVSGNDGVIMTGTNNGNGLTLTHAGTGKDLNATTSGPLQVNATQINSVSAGSVTTINANIGTTQPFNFTGTAGSALVKADMVDIAGAAVSTSSAQIGVNAVQINAVSTSSVTTINANQGTTQPLNFTGTAGSALVKSDMQDIAGSAVSTSSAQLGVNVVNIAGSAAALDANNFLKVDIEAINASTTAAVNLGKSAADMGRGTCTTGGSTTSIPTSAFSPGGAGIVSGQFIGRTLIFDGDTTTASLRGQATAITANTSGATPTFTVVALTTSPSSGDVFSVV